MPRESLVEERVVGTPQFDRIAVISKLAEQKEFGFFREGIAQRDVVIGEELLVRIGMC